jgi:cell division protein ZapA
MMTQVTVSVGGREFDVACRDGEEPYLRAAAALLDAEAATLLGQMGRMPETTMLLMSGLMLADKTAAQEDRLRRAEEKLAAREARIAELENRPPPEPERIEVPVPPPGLADDLAALAARAEAVADGLEAEAAPAG